jgi:hypothetical protein
MVAPPWLLPMAASATAPYAGQLIPGEAFVGVLVPARGSARGR